KMLRETDLTKQRDLMREFEKYVLDDQAHAVFLLWWSASCAPILRQGLLENRSEPLPQPGSGDSLARQVKSRITAPYPSHRRTGPRSGRPEDKVSVRPTRV